MRLEDYVDFDRNTPEFIRFVAEFLFETGIRPKELWLVSKSNLSYIDGVFDYKQPKTQIRRVVKLPAYLLEKARFFRKHYGNFASIFRTYKNLSKSVLRFCHPIVYIENAHNKLYYFRYLYVLKQLKSGILPEQIARNLGHSDFATVKDYIKHARFIEQIAIKKGV